MKAENLMQFLMDFHNCENRQRCLNLIFMASDAQRNFYWIYGELQPTDYLDTDGILQRWSLTQDIEFAKPRETVVELQSVRDSVLEHKFGKEKYAEMQKEDKWSHTDISKSYICNYPEDITADWLKLINECKSMLEEDGISVPDNKPYKYE